MERRLPRFDISSLNTVNFRQRLITALVLGPLVLLTVYIGHWLYPAVVTVIVTLGLREWLRLVYPDATRPVKGFALFTLLMVMLSGAWFSVSFGAMIGIVLGLVLFLLAVRHHPDHQERAGWVALGIPYMAGSGLALFYIRAIPSLGMQWTYYLLAVVWGTDIGAYIAGRLFNGPKLAPDISPNKTWAGLWGGMALAAFSGYVLSIGFGAEHPIQLIGLAVILAGVSQLGDLFESYFKRRSGVKESGGLIPGHGGILDRIDGLVFAAIFLMLFHLAVGNHSIW